MFIKDYNYGWICDCGTNTFTIEYKGHKITLTNQVKIDLNHFNELILYKKTCFPIFILGGIIEPLEDIVELFNQQMIQALYEPGGEKYRESEKWVNTN